MDVIPGLAPRTYPGLRSLVRANEWDGMWPDDKTPCLLVINTGLADEPERNGSGTYDVKWRIAAAIVVGSNSRTATRDMAFIYGHAFREMILQHKSLEHPEHMAGLHWMDSRPMPLPSEQTRSLMAIQMFFDVQAKGVLTDKGTTPFPDPQPDPYIPDPPPVIPDPGDPTPPGPGDPPPVDDPSAPSGIPITVPGPADITLREIEE